MFDFPPFSTSFINLLFIHTINIDIFPFFPTIHPKNSFRMVFLFIMEIIVKKGYN